MEIIPLASESMGTRSMATFIETDDLCILFDPGVSLLKDKKGLQPHSLETWRLKQHLERIQLFANKADIVILSHFHPSHIAKKLSVYSGKSVYLKNPNQQTDPDQRCIAFGLMQQLKGVAKEILFADGRTVRRGDTKIVFSNAVPHGEEGGSVIQIFIHSKENSLLITSDVEGPLTNQACEFIIDQQPKTLYLDGLPTGKPGFSQVRFTQGLERFEKLLDSLNLERVVLDHHLLRDIEWEAKFNAFLQLGKKKKVAVITAACLRGEENDVFEARREQLYANDKIL